MPLLRKTTTAKTIDLSISGLDKLVATDPTVPRPIKMGESRQSAVYFDESELNAWIESKKAARPAVLEVVQ